MSAQSAVDYRGFEAAIDNADRVREETLLGESELDHARRIQAAFDALAKYVPDMQQDIINDSATLVQTLEQRDNNAKQPLSQEGSFIGRIRAKAQANQRSQGLNETLEGVYDSLGETIYVCRERLKSLPRQ